MRLPFFALALISLFAVQAATLGQEIDAPANTSGTADGRVGPRASEPLRQFNTSLVALTKEVSPAVVQVMVTAYGPVDRSTQNDDAALFVRQQSIGSGVILDPNGYIITNAHVVKGAQRVRIALADKTASSPLDMAPVGKRKSLDAKLIGIDKDTDLALLKVDAHNLPVLALGAARPVYPGEVVLAIGSPEGLQNSVTMGIVSSVWRQPAPDKPMVYI
jgi:serine protease Do